MPLSAAEKQRRYRERCKEKGSHEEMKAKDRARKKEKRRSLSTAALKALRREERERKRQARAKNDTGTPATASNAEQSYKNPQSLGKAVKRVSQHLPCSPRKRSRVIKTLARKFAVPTADNDSSRNGPNKVPDELCKAIATFYCRDDISWQSPNRKDVVISRKEDGTKEYIQKRFLVMTLKECYNLYLEENPYQYVGLSKFCSLRPCHVSLSRDFPHNVCICKYHENIKLLLECIDKSVGRKIPTHFHDFIATVVCDQEKESCMFGKCSACRSKFDDTYCFPEEADHQAEWIQWITVEGKATKSLQQDTLSECIKSLRQQLPGFLIHTFIKRKQSAHFEREKDKADGRHVVVQVDFAENYSIIHQNEIQSGHWNHEQVTIFTGCAYTGNGQVESFAIVSDDMVHGKYQVATFLDHIIMDLKKSCPEVETVSFFSDGAASQFKQRFLFENLTYFSEMYNIQASWNFFATSHGKGSVDGVGGQIKRLVFTACKTGAFITDAQSFATEAKKHTTKIKVMFIPATDVEARKDILDARWANVSALPNTHNTHVVVPLRKHVVSYAVYATSDSYKEFELIKAGKNTPTGASEAIEHDQEIGLSGPSTSETATSEASTLEPSTSGTSTSDPLTAEPSTSQPSTSQPSTSGPMPSSSKLASTGLSSPGRSSSDGSPDTQPIPKLGDFVLVQYLGANKVKKAFKYAAQVTSVNDKEFLVMHLHKGDTEGIMFKAKDHTDKYAMVSQKQILEILPTPVIDKRGRFHFPTAISEAN